MKILRIGDPHIKMSNLAEAERLFSFVEEQIDLLSPSRVEILGDLMHNHAVLRAEVVSFWYRWLKRLKSKIEVIVLVGNHDMVGDFNSSTHGLVSFKEMEDDSLRIIDEPTLVGIYGYMPYVHHKERFGEIAQDLFDRGARVLVCHQTFSGSVFENNFYAPDGINPDELPFETVISGHIHKSQIIAGGKVDYPGTPKWDTASDANEEKGIWVYKHDLTTGKVVSREMIPTNSVVTPIFSFVWKEGEEEPIIPEGSRSALELIGTGDWVSKQRSRLKGKASISSKITDKKTSRLSVSSMGFAQFLSTKYSNNIKLLEYAREVGLV